MAEGRVMAGRPLKCNLLRDGFEAAAEHVGETVSKTLGRHVVEVPPTGGVRVRSIYKVAADLDAILASPDCIGVFDRRSRVEHIEGDMLARLRELNQAPA